MSAHAEESIAATGRYEKVCIPRSLRIDEEHQFAGTQVQRREIERDRRYVAPLGRFAEDAGRDRAGANVGVVGHQCVTLNLIRDARERHRQWRYREHCFGLLGISSKQVKTPIHAGDYWGAKSASNACTFHLAQLDLRRAVRSETRRVFGRDVTRRAARHQSQAYRQHTAGSRSEGRRKGQNVQTSSQPRQRPAGWHHSRCLKSFGVADGTRTHDNRNHNPGLYQLSYSHHSKSGLPDRTRTCDPQLRRLVLYPAELRADQSSERAHRLVRRYGRGGEIRTPDILLPKQARYQTALHPEGTG
jgi:hypothetical protein